MHRELTVESPGPFRRATQLVLHRTSDDLQPVAHARQQTVVHPSWLNQIEIYFSVTQRKLLTPDDSDDLATLAERIQAFEQRYNNTAEPFDWRFNTDDLHRLLQRLKP